VTRLAGSPTGVEAQTPTGHVRARSAVLAVGAAAKSPHGPLRNFLTVASSHIVLTEPVPELLEEIGWTGGECITDSRSLIDYFRTTPDGRIAFGWGGGRIAMGARLHGRSELDPQVIAEAAEHLWTYFPGLAGKSLTHAWGGPIDASPTHLPLVLPLRGSRAFCAAGYTGNGVGPSHMVGRTLAWRSSTRPRLESLPSPSTGWAERRSAWGSCARRRPSLPVALQTRSAPRWQGFQS
jgi:glycine/D-amino acid oxidase-like deaminating enzyme